MDPTKGTVLRAAQLFAHDTELLFVPVARLASHEGVGEGAADDVGAHHDHGAADEPEFPRLQVHGPGVHLVGVKHLQKRRRVEMRRDNGAATCQQSLPQSKGCRRVGGTHCVQLLHAGSFSRQPQPAVPHPAALLQRPTLTSRCGRRGSSALVEPCSTITYLQGGATGRVWEHGRPWWIEGATCHTSTRLACVSNS